MRHAVEGISVSGVTVVQMMRSISSREMPETAMAFSAALLPIFHVGIFIAQCLVFIPVRVVIHSSFVSMNDVKSLFSMTVSGTYEAMPEIFIPCNKISPCI